MTIIVTQTNYLSNKYSYVPAELVALPQWVVWKYEARPGQSKQTKIPYNPSNGRKASSTDPSTWGSFDDAVAVEKAYTGIGFTVTDSDPYLAIDIDNCIVNGELTDDAKRLVAKLDSYTEVTPSGVGLRVWLRGRKPESRSKNSSKNVEIYESRRYFTVTGRHLDGTPTTINDRQAELTTIYNELFPPKATDQQKPVHTPVAIPTDLDDRGILDCMFGSKNGASILALWNGDTSAYNGDASSADQALCNHLAFWCGRDASRMDRLFRQSDLMRPKWDRHARSGETYGQGTIRTAIESCLNVFTPRNTAESETTKKTNVAATINAAREFVRHADLRELAGVKRATNLVRVADAVLDVLEQRNRLTTSIPVRLVAESAGVGKSSANRLLPKLTPWLLKLESASVENTAAVYSLNPSFCVDGTVFFHSKGGNEGGCPIYAKTPITPITAHKAADPFNQGGSKNQLHRALRLVIGDTATDVLEELESHDFPRVAAIRSFNQRVAEQATQEQPDPALDSWIEAEAQKLKYDPQPVELRSTIKRYNAIENEDRTEVVDTLGGVKDWPEGVRVLLSEGLIVVEEGTIKLISGYVTILNTLTKSLGPVALRVIDALTECDGQSNGEIAKGFSLSEGSVSRACTALERMGVIESKRDGLKKCRYLNPEWVAIIRTMLPRMKTNGLRHKRALAYAAEAYNHCVHLLKTETDPQKCEKIKRRQERAQDRLIALADQEAPGLADNESFTKEVQAVTSTAKAPEMPEPGVLAWHRLVDLTGKGLLTNGAS